MVCLKYLFTNCYSIDHIEQQRDIPEKNLPYAPPPDDQRVYEFVQDEAPDPNVYAVVQKQPQSAAVEPDQSNEYQAFDEMPTTSAADSTQHYAVINNHTNKRNAQAYDKLNRKI